MEAREDGEMVVLKTLEAEAVSVTSDAARGEQDDEEVHTQVESGNPRTKIVGQNQAMR